MNALVHQRRAAGQRPGAAPARVRVILRRAVPLDAGRRQEWLSEFAGVKEFFEPDQVRGNPVLEEDAELNARPLTLSDQHVSLFGRDGEGLFNQEMQATPRRLN